MNPTILRQMVNRLLDETKIITLLESKDEKQSKNNDTIEKERHHTNSSHTLVFHFHIYLVSQFLGKCFTQLLFLTVCPTSSSCAKLSSCNITKTFQLDTGI